MLSYLLPFYTFFLFEITTDSHAAGRTSTERSYISLSLNARILHIMIMTRKLTQVQLTDPTQISPALHACVYLVLCSPVLHARVYVSLDPSCYPFTVTALSYCAIRAPASERSSPGGHGGFFSSTAIHPALLPLLPWFFSHVLKFLYFYLSFVVLVCLAFYKLFN